MAKVLVVDDEPGARNALVRLLRHQGYDVTIAGDGKEALNILEGERPDLLLLDILMPELDGLALLEILHEDPRWKSLPVVMLTAVSDTHTVNRANQLGAKAFLVKAAFSVPEMLDHVKKYTEAAAAG